MRNLMIFVQISMSVRQQTLLVQQDIIASTIWEAMLVIVQGDMKARPVKLVSYFISIRGLLNFSTRFIPKRALRERKWEKSYPWYRATLHRKQHNTFPRWLSLVFDNFFFNFFFTWRMLLKIISMLFKRALRLLREKKWMFPLRPIISYHIQHFIPIKVSITNQYLLTNYNQLNSLFGNNISIHILHTPLYKFPLVMIRRIYVTIKASYIGDHFSILITARWN